jgi:hypothetical protein
MAFEEWTIMVLWLTLGAVAGMLYVLRRIFLLEKKILNVETIILRMEKSQIKLEKAQLEALAKIPKRKK